MGLDNFTAIEIVKYMYDHLLWQAIFTRKYQNISKHIFRDKKKQLLINKHT